MNQNRFLFLVKLYAHLFLLLKMINLTMFNTYVKLLC